MKLDAALALVGNDYGPTPCMLANIIFRFILNLGAALACWVPLRLFHKNGELAGTSMVLATAILNFFYALNAVIWPTNDINHWVKGYGWCDLQLALWMPLETLNAAAVCAVMQNIADQVSVLRASALTRKEKRRKHIIQALIIFPVPVLQVVLYYFAIAMRYNISGVIGCQAVFVANWVFLVFFLIPCPIFAVGAAYFAGLTWWRYKQIDKTLRRMLYSSGIHGTNQAQSTRTRRKLYFMALTIVVPYCPMQLTFLFNNVKLGWPWSDPYDLADLHRPGWGDRIDYAPSTVVSFVSMYINYIAALEVVVFFLYFGRTKEAHDMYRRYLRTLGLGKYFPWLNEDWTPSNRSSVSVKSLWPRAKSISSSHVTSTHSRSSSMQTIRAPPRSIDRRQPRSDDRLFKNIRLTEAHLEAAHSLRTYAQFSTENPQLPYRSPFIFRTTATPHYEFPTLPAAVFRSNKANIATKDKPVRATRQHQTAGTPRTPHVARHPPTTAASLGDWRPNDDPVISPRTWAAFAFDIPESDDKMKLSGSEKGFVSMRRAAADSSGKVKTPVWANWTK